MEMYNILLANGFFLSAILLILIIMYFNKLQSTPRKAQANVRNDLKRIKSQILKE